MSNMARGNGGLSIAKQAALKVLGTRIQHAVSDYGLDDAVTRSAIEAYNRLEEELAIDEAEEEGPKHDDGEL